MGQAIFRRLLILSWIAGTLLFVSPRLLAQATGTISGYVKDSSGGVVPQATVRAVLVARGASTITVTNSTGFYNFPVLEPGVYTLTVEKAGFEQSIQPGLTLTVGQNLRVDATLEVGTVSNRVTVSAAAPLVDTTSATISGLVNDQRIVDLPLNGRNIIGLAVIVPGVSNVSAPAYTPCVRGGATMNVNGSSEDQNNFSFDGAFFENASRNTAMNYPPPDAIQEFRIQTANFDAEYGHNSGSQVTVVSKTGTNQFHGALWEFLRNNALDARNFFTPTVPGLEQNQFGGVAGGPVKQNKLFFFGSYEGLREIPQVIPCEAFVPSAAERSGDFTSLLPGTVLTDPVNALTGQPLTDSMGKTCVLNNIINPNCITTAAEKLLAFVPESASGSLVELASAPVTANTFFGRMDANLSPKNLLFGHVFISHTKQPQPFSCANISGYEPINDVEETDMVTLNDTWSISPTLVNQAIVSYLRTSGISDNTRNIETSALGIDMPQYATPGTIAADVAGWFSLGAGYNNTSISNNYEVRDVLTWMKGKHTFMFGGEYLRPNFIQRFIGPPTFSFSGSASGNPMSDFLLGEYNTVCLQYGIANNDDLTTIPSAFFQDAFKVTPRVTLTYGARYDPDFFWYDAHNELDAIKVGVQSTVEPSAPPGILFPGDPGVSRDMSPTAWNDIAPRVGFAWDVFGNGKTAVRGAYGVFFDAINADINAQENAPWVGDAVEFDGNIADPFGSLGLSNPPVTPTGQFGCVKISASPGYNCPLFPLPATGYFGGTTLRTPYVQQANVTLQHQITPSTMLEGGYLGEWGIKLTTRIPFNPAAFVPGTVYDSSSGSENTVSTPENVDQRTLYEPGTLAPSASIFASLLRSWYNSFYTQVTKHMSHGFTLTGTYTLSKAIDTGDTYYEQTTITDPFNVNANRGRASFDRRNVVSASYLWSLPFRFRSREINALLGNWTLSGITSLDSGLPITFLNGVDTALDGTDWPGQETAFRNGQRIALSHASTGATVQRFFNTGAFVSPVCGFVPQPGNPQVIQQENCTPYGYKYSLLGQFGQSGSGILSGPAYFDTDFSVLKDFPITETKRLEFRAEFFDIFNSPDFGLPASTVTDSDFGQITSAGNSRVIQFGLKFYW